VLDRFSKLKPLAAAFQKLSAGLDGQISFNWQELEQTFEFRRLASLNRTLLYSGRLLPLFERRVSSN